MSLRIAYSLVVSFVLGGFATFLVITHEETGELPRLALAGVLVFAFLHLAYRVYRIEGIAFQILDDPIEFSEVPVPSELRDYVRRSWKPGNGRDYRLVLYRNGALAVFPGVTLLTHGEREGIRRIMAEVKRASLSSL